MLNLASKFWKVEGYIFFQYVCKKSRQDSKNCSKKDLNTWQGIVRGKVALLLWSTEIQPSVTSIRPSPLLILKSLISSKLFASFRSDVKPSWQPAFALATWHI